MVHMRAVIDRFENVKAVLLLGDDLSVQAVWPRRFLPEAAEEGDILKLEFRIDAEATAQAKAAAEDLLRQLLRNNKNESGA